MPLILRRLSLPTIYRCNGGFEPCSALCCSCQMRFAASLHCSVPTARKQLRRAAHSFARELTKRGLVPVGGAA